MAWRRSWWSSASSTRISAGSAAGHRVAMRSCMLTLTSARMPVARSATSSTDDLGAPAGPALDRELGTDCIGTFPHADEAVVVARDDGPGSKPVPSSETSSRATPSWTSQRTIDLGGVGVALDVDEGLLDDPPQLLLDPVGQRGRRPTGSSAW